MQKSGNNFFKVNWDATLDERNSKMGAGVVIRNWEGDQIATLCKPQFFVSHPVIA